jgi:PhnB protein
MPKRSLGPGKDDPRRIDRTKIEQLNQAVEKMLARTDGKAPKVEAAIEPLLRIAADLRDLPRESFKTRLKSEFEGRKSMSTVAEPVAAVRTTALPRLAFKDPAKAIEFYKNAFGARETFRFEVASKIAHAEMTIGESVIKLAEEWPEGGRFSAETLGNSPVSLVIHVADVDSFAERAVAAGMKVIRPLKDQFYGHRDVTMADPFGYLWTAVTVKEEMSVEEMHRRMDAMMKPAGEGAAPPKPAVSPIPKGFRTVTPYIVASDGAAMIEFAKKALSVVETYRAIGPAGGIHAEVRLGDSMIMMGGGIPGKPFQATPTTIALHVYVPDIDAVYRKALDAGGTSIDEPQDHEYGERGASVQDPFGNYWYIATYKGPNYKWEGAPDVQPYLHPLRAEPVLSFLKRAFGAVELGKYASPDGVIHHATLKIGDSHLEMGEAHGKYQPLNSMFYLYVPDVDDVYRRALAAGATSIAEPKDQPYGDRSAGVKDVFGNQWYIATHIKDVAH